MVWQKKVRLNNTKKRQLRVSSQVSVHIQMHCHAAATAATVKQHEVLHRSIQSKLRIRRIVLQSLCSRFPLHCIANFDMHFFSLLA